ncbi:PrsW family intramembrane metalloprotease [Haloquadratum walsbyi]|jgi:Predicted membrane protein|uniref:Putative membrane protein n=1 Tax=Haloquadratum walsbyi J07HQW2 TaxID=1238425 RepID=U1NGJ6_9EURY|nr:PrsW family intramembrane metalloprotease [Haloquadratum walsbyi]ERG96250.1 MAG: putative membrane protein [Haloquadratum walsbyi J07HQW2]
MVKPEDPIEEAADDSLDLYDIATWEVRSNTDRVASVLWWLLAGSARVVIILIALILLLAVGGLAALTDPQTGILTALSAIPAVGLAVYVSLTDITETEPISLLVATFLLGVLTANFAAVLNTVLRPYFVGLGFISSIIFFFVVVGPIEESVKLLAVRLYAYSDDRFDSVLDGAVYGAMAGLGFAVIENALYIARQLPNSGLDIGLGLIGAGGGITAVRALAGPGHVIYSAIAGYYLGLAKFNPGQRGPIIMKGILLAAVIHAMYNATVGVGSGLIASVTGFSGIIPYLIYVISYDSVFGLMLFIKIRRYCNSYQRVHSTDREAEISPDESDVTQ